MSVILTVDAPEFDVQKLLEMYPVPKGYVYLGMGRTFTVPGSSSGPILPHTYGTSGRVVIASFVALVLRHWDENPKWRLASVIGQSNITMYAVREDSEVAMLNNIMPSPSLGNPTTANILML